MLELPPGGIVDFAAGVDRRAEIQRIAHEQVLIEPAGEHVFAAPIEVASSEQQRGREGKRRARIHRRFASNCR